MTSGNGHDTVAGDLEITPMGTEVRIRAVTASGAFSLVCSPDRARELAAALGAAADYAASARTADPVTVRADGLRRGDVRDGERVMTVESVRTDGATVHIGWKSGAGRGWNQSYDADAMITLRRRGPEPAV
ncbi:hypothetical protein [Streptomyces sp. NPDC059783]|uniref:hypothetical protein n=1 Tax=Streptomyces sp. NPDC059783 TaxID=3346944 RepID=UPI003667CD28